MEGEDTGRTKGRKARGRKEKYKGKEHEQEKSKTNVAADFERQESGSREPARHHGY